jgi:hypothetical protein
MPDFARLPARPSLEQLQKQAKDLLREYRAGESAAGNRLRAAGRSEPPTLADAQFALAREYGFESWAKLKRHVEMLSPAGAAAPLYRIDGDILSVRGVLPETGWDTICHVVRERGITHIESGGMTDAGLERVARLGQVTRLSLGNSSLLTDDGLRHVARMARLEELDLSGAHGQITDRGLAVLRQLPELRRFKMCWQPGISDVGAANLAICEHLERVDLMGTPTGDGAVRALAGKPRLRHFRTGREVTDAGLETLHHFPIFKSWMGGEVRYGLMSAQAEPNHLMVDGPFSNAGIASLAGLDGLFGLSFFWHSTEMTGAGLEPLRQLPHLGMLGCGEKRCDDEAMRHIAAMPRLRMLMAQGTVASDGGFRALSRSASIEYLWGRECPNLTGRGFAALSEMTALRGLAVSCKQVDDAALALLPRFPALCELLPMDVGDEGFRHVGRCGGLEALWCMYCGESGDAATEHIAGLPRLKSYYAGQTRITDRGLEVLGRMLALERIELRACAGVTDAGVSGLVGLPRLRELILDNLPAVSREAAALFPAGVRVMLR